MMAGWLAGLALILLLAAAAGFWLAATLLL